MISEIAVPHTSSCMVRGTVVLVLYYSYTYWDPKLRKVLFTVVLPIFLLSISGTLQRWILAPNTGSSKTSWLLFYINETVSTCNNNNGYSIEDKDERFIYSRTSSRTYLKSNGLFNNNSNGSAPPVHI